MPKKAQAPTDDTPSVAVAVSAANKVADIPHIMRAIVNYSSLKTLQLFALANAQCFSLAAPRLYHTIRFTIGTATDACAIGACYPFRPKPLEPKLAQPAESSKLRWARSIALHCVRDVVLPRHESGTCCSTIRVEREDSVRIERLIQDLGGDSGSHRCIPVDFVPTHSRRETGTVRGVDFHRNYKNDDDEGGRGKLRKTTYLRQPYMTLSRPVAGVRMLRHPSLLDVIPNVNEIGDLDHIVIVLPELDHALQLLPSTPHRDPSLARGVWHDVLSVFESSHLARARILIIEPAFYRPNAPLCDPDEDGVLEDAKDLRSCKHRFRRWFLDDFVDDPARDDPSEALKQWDRLSFMTAREYRQTSIWEEGDLPDGYDGYDDDDELSGNEETSAGLERGRLAKDQ